MGKKPRSSKLDDPGNAAGFEINPFAGLSSAALGLAKPAPADKPARQEQAAKAPAAARPLGREDQELLRCFGEATLPGAAPSKRRGTIRLQVQRRGRGGKTVTRIIGLAGLGAVEEMALVDRLKRELGTGAHLRDGVVELQGDLRQRAAEWFAKEQYNVCT